MNLDQQMQHFLAALELEGVARQDYLAAIEDVDLRAAVEELLRVHDSATVEGLPVLPSAAPGPVDLVGQSLEGFRLVRRVAEGGMGVVYQAEQDKPRRQVAVKVLHAGASAEALKRFEYEAEILARLEHPGIARIYQAGVASTPFGELPYIALEWIDGLGLAAAARELEPRDRLARLAEICEAVAYAHQQGVIHRDLKPSNILIDRTGRPKVLDFGIARLVEADEERSLATRTGQILGTLHYMSPEQLNGAQRDVDTRSDVYALGVVGYEILTGQRPIDVEGFSITRAIQELSQRDGSRLSSHDSRLSGDPEIVIAKAMRKERGERYGTAAEMGADLRRLLAHEPIAARPPSRRYLMRKFVRRHAVGLTALTVVVVGLAVGLIIALRARDDALAAEGESRVAAMNASDRAASLRRVVDLFGRVISLDAPSERVGREPLKLQEAIAFVVERQEESLQQAPFAAAQLLTQIAVTSIQEGDLVEAEGLLVKARSALERSPLTDVRDRLRFEIQWYKCRLAADAPLAEMTAIAERAGKLAEGLSSADQLPLAQALSMQAEALNQPGKREKSLSLAKRALAVFAMIDDPEGKHRQEYGALCMTIGFTHFSRREHKVAQGYFREALGIFGERANTNLSRSSALAMIGECYTGMRDFDQAIPVLRQAIEVASECYEGKKNRTLGKLHNLLAQAQDASRDLRAAVKSYEQAIANFGEPGQKGEMQAAAARMRLGWVLYSKGEKTDVPRARRELVQAKSDFERFSGPKSPFTAMALWRLGAIERDDGSIEKAEELSRASTKIFDGGRYADSSESMGARICLAQVFMRTARPGEAVPLLESALAYREKNFGASAPSTKQCAALLKKVRGQVAGQEKSVSPAARK